MPEPVFNRTESRGRSLPWRPEALSVRCTLSAGRRCYSPTTPVLFTRDIDALFSTDGPMLEAIRSVVDEMGWSATWLTNQASGYLPHTR